MADQFQEFIKDPAAEKPYGIDWTEWAMGDDIITGSIWSVPAGLQKLSDSFQGMVAVVWLAGGTLGQKYTVTNRVTTRDGVVDERSITIRIKDR